MSNQPKYEFDLEYLAGWHAGHRGEISGNPYPHLSDRAIAWEDGNKDARNGTIDARKALGKDFKK